MTVRILLVENDRLARNALKHVLKGQSSFQVVGEAKDGQEACDMAVSTKPDVILMDVGMPVMDGVEATRRITQKNPAAQVLAISTHDEQVWVRSMFEAGAKGFILKDSGNAILCTAVEAVAAGKFYIDQGIITDVVMKDYVQQIATGKHAIVQSITKRKGLILQYIAEGCSVKEIASRMDLSRKTVDKHKREIMQELGAKTPAELLNYALKYSQSSPKKPLL